MNYLTFYESTVSLHKTVVLVNKVTNKPDFGSDEKNKIIQAYALNIV